MWVILQNLHSDTMKRFGLEPDMSSDAVQEKLKELEEQIKREIQKELKMKEGAENMRRAVQAGGGDRKSRSNVDSVIRKAKDRLEELNQDLSDVRTYVIMVGGKPTSKPDGSGKR